MDMLQPGDLPSTDDINRWRQQQEQSRPMLPAPTAGQMRFQGALGETDIPWQPEYRWVRITGEFTTCSGSGASGSGPFAGYTWTPIRPNVCGQALPDDSLDQGTQFYQPAWEITGNLNVPIDGTAVVQLWEWWLDVSGSGTGRNWVFFWPAAIASGSGQNYIDVVTCVQVVIGSSGSGIQFGGA